MRSFNITLGALLVFAVACSGNGNTTVGSNGGNAGVGGNPTTGGSSAVTSTAPSGGSGAAGGLAATGGVSVASTGGAQGQGGTQGQGGAPASGGASSGGSKATTGGATDAGGAQNTGGSRASTGGAQGTGGSKAATGGAQDQGGATAAGGAQSTGGSMVATGGTQAQGGTKATGGASSGGGVTSAGGAKSTGGAPATGGASGTAGSTGAQHWVGTWTASPYYDSGNQPPASLSNAVLRQVAHVSLGGNQIRVQFSNLSSNGSVTINSAHIALCKATPAVDSTIDTSTDKALAFSAAASVTIAQGKEVWSDPIDFTVPNQGNITITAAFGSVPSQVCGHSGSRTTSYIQTGSSNVSAASMTSATTTEHWYYISGIDVMADASARGVVAIGDSITDGRGTDTNHNNRWTDVLAARLQGNAATANVSMMNQGIGATNLVGTSGTAAQARFNRDVLGQSGVKYAIVLDGVNDIGGGAAYSSLKSAYDDLVSRAHAKGLLIYGGTILPFNGNSYYTTEHESVRQQVNTYIKSGAFDGYIDFDAALRDPSDPTKLQATYAQWSQEDWLHPGPAGYQKMGETADLTLFTN